MQYDLGMRKTPIAELTPRTIALLNACPRCGGDLKALILVGYGECQPQRQVCVSHCGFDKDISKAKHK